MSRREGVVIYLAPADAAKLRALAAESRAPGAAWSRAAIESLLLLVERMRAESGRLPTVDEVYSRMVRP